ncbi:MAG: hypothetical protein ACR2P3_01920 [Geminicoccaceae bacterium]
MADNVIDIEPRRRRPKKPRFSFSCLNVQDVYSDERSPEEIADEWSNLTAASVRRIKSGKTYASYTGHHANKRQHNSDRLKGAALSKHRERTLGELVDYVIEHYGFILEKHRRFTAKFLATHFDARRNNPSSHVTKFKETVVPSIADTYVEQDGYPCPDFDLFQSTFDYKDGEPISVRDCHHLIEHFVPSWPEGVGRSIMFTVLYLLRTDRPVSSKQWRSVCYGMVRLCKDDGDDEYARFFKKWIGELDDQINQAG